MKNQPLVSVIMSVYNGEKYLDEAIQSVLDQTYKNFEFIIINDGSLDRSLEIIKKYEEKDTRIVIITRKNKGLIASLNEGIEKAKGKYIARMDADDICLIDRFEEQISFMHKNNLDLCGSWVLPFNSDKDMTVWKYPETHNDTTFRLFFMSSFAHPSVMMKKSIFQTLKYENEVAEDYSLWCDIVTKGYKVGNIQKVLLRYRMHENQITQTKSKELSYSSDKIGIEFIHNIDKEMTGLVKQAIEVKNNNNYFKFSKLLKELLISSGKYSVSENNLKFIIETIYNNASPKTPLIYYLYFKATKEMKRNINEELQLFFKSWIILNRESYIYQELKKIKLWYKRK